MSYSRLLNPKTQRLQFLPPRIPKRVNQLNLSIFAKRVSPNRGASCPLTRQKLGKSDTDNQSHWASPASCPNLFIAAQLYISQQHFWIGNCFKAFELVSKIMLAKFTLLYFAARPSSISGWGENFPGNKIRFGLRLRLLVSCRYLQHFLSKRRLPTIEGSDV